jgi:ubiquinone/menaquinone biosynthesis C-methylase UbiE
MITFITSLYRSDEHIERYSGLITRFHDDLASKSIEIEIVIIANDPTEKENACLDDLSTDALNSEGKAWVRIIKVPRESLYASWNRGVREARGEIVGFWNVDDERYPEAIPASLEAFGKGAQLVYFPFIYKRYVHIAGIDMIAKVRKIDPPLFDQARFRNEMHAGPFFMFKRETVGTVGIFDESFKIAGDFDWLSRASQLIPFTKVDAVAGVFKNNGRTLSGSRNSLQQDENMRVTGQDLLSTTFNIPFMDALHHYEDPQGNIRLYHHLKARIALDFLKEHASKEKVFLDAGAGRGQYCFVAKDFYKTVYCFEYDESELAVAQKFINASHVMFNKADLTALPLKDKEADIIVCSEVLEHIKDNGKALKELYRVLKDDGFLLLSMPNRFSLFYQKVMMKNKKTWYPKPKEGASDPYFEARRHVEYPFWKIEKLARSAGFKVAKRQGANSFPLPDRLRKKIMRNPRHFHLYLKVEKVLSSLLPFCSSFYFITLKKS